MKILSLPILLFALLALSLAADAVDESEINAGDSEDAEDKPEINAGDSEGESHVEKRATSCPSGWTKYGARCFRYISASYTWAQAENYCVRYQSGNLPSVHSAAEYSWLQSYVRSKTCGNPTIWLGGSDAEQERMWFWSDGSRLSYNSWCSGTPRASTSYNCIIMNASSRRCWYDYPCGNRYAFVCAKKL
ncbi:ladderlectin-like isoform X1 [Kryptolebias marmoratus]|uniref:ladderlectin-like isoform X1 n=1 Tax=Kryptolebias marmoratus TaxID=37003 RepID=UPI0007F89AC4|nr:ladderlectin-like isoform X1 [Kryptolebias marmoratus]